MKDRKVNKNIELTIPFVQLPNHVSFQTINYDANVNTIQNHFGKNTNSQSFLTCLFQLNPFLSCIMKENLLELPQLLYGTMII
jgi:hypothetical protein